MSDSAANTEPEETMLEGEDDGGFLPDDVVSEEQDGDHALAGRDRVKQGSHAKEKIKKPMRMASQNHRMHHENPNIYYMNGDALSRPLDTPKGVKRGLIVLVIIAAAIGIAFLSFYLDGIINEPLREQQRLEESLTRSVSFDLPNLISFVDMDDSSIDASLKETGATFFEKSPLGSGSAYEIIKLPSDVTLADAAMMYANGINKLTAVQAVTLLNGAWDLSIDRTTRFNMSLHYADFKTGSERAAIQNAITLEGLDRGEEEDSGDDDGYGNAYSSGKITVDGTEYDWRVSALPLSKVYSIAGLPDNAIYVGIRITS